MITSSRFTTWENALEEAQFIAKQEKESQAIYSCRETNAFYVLPSRLRKLETIGVYTK